MEFLKVSMGFLDPDSIGITSSFLVVMILPANPQTEPACKASPAFPKRRVLKCSPRGIWPVGGVKLWGKNWWVFVVARGGSSWWKVRKKANFVFVEAVPFWVEIKKWAFWWFAWDFITYPSTKIFSGWRMNDLKTFTKLIFWEAQPSPSVGGTFPNRFGAISFGCHDFKFQEATQEIWMILEDEFHLW